MTKRTDVVQQLKQAGFWSVGGTKHEKFKNKDGRYTTVPRHKEISNTLAKEIMKQAGIK